MAATSSGAVKAFLEAQGLGVAVYRDVAPASAVLPYVTVQEGISLVPEDHGDHGADAAVTELVQVDLWQAQGAETYTLPDAVVGALHGAVLTQHPKHVYGCVVRSAVRLIEPKTNDVHLAITTALRRAI